MEREMMKMSNSPLVSYTSLSPNCSKPRNNKILKITPHHMAGNLSLQTFDNIVSNPSRQMSSNYAIDSYGKIGLFCEEKNRSWCSSSPSNDNQAITIEVANDGGEPDWHVSDKALNALIDLCVDICQRNGIEKLIFTGNANGNLTQHNYFAATACPGPYLKSKFSYIADTVNARLNDPQPTPTPTPSGDFIPDIAKLVQTYAPQYNILVHSPIIAQAILESASGTSELAINACNYFGLKWREGRCPTAIGIYTKETTEWVNGQYVTITSDFCKFADMNNGVQGYFDFTNISNYSNLKGVTDPETYLKNIKADGYATSPTYVEDLMAVIDKYNLTQYDEVEPQGDLAYRVKTANKCQAFYSKNVDDVAMFGDSMYMPLGDYKITNLEETASTGGFKWAQIVLETSAELWVVYDLADERDDIVEWVEPTPVDPEIEKLQKELEEAYAKIELLEEQIEANEEEIAALKEMIADLEKKLQEINKISSVNVDFSKAYPTEK